MICHAKNYAIQIEIGSDLIGECKTILSKIAKRYVKKNVFIGFKSVSKGFNRYFH